MDGWKATRHQGGQQKKIWVSREKKTKGPASLSQTPLKQKARRDRGNSNKKIDKLQTHCVIGLALGLRLGITEHLLQEPFNRKPDDDTRGDREVVHNVDKGRC